MVDKATDQSIIDKSMRSVFVGNIPYEATEEKLKEIFSEVGPVVSLKLVFDRESGKPKGFGFCEYKDQETALSAMRNLNGFEIGGRNLRVDNACTEKSRMEMQQLLQGPQVENPYGEPCEPEQAPERITKTVASMPPEQMYEVLRQVKLCMQNNPNEARQMLMLNPQLSYAILQILVVSRIVDPQRALNMLFKANQMPPVFGGQQNKQMPQAQQQQQQQQQQQHAAQMLSAQLANFNHNMQSTGISAHNDLDLRTLTGMNPAATAAQRVGIDSAASLMSRNMDQDMRTMPNPVPPPLMPDPRQRQMPPQAVNAAAAAGVYPTDTRRMDPRLRGAVPMSSTAAAQQAAATQQQLQSRAMANCGLPVDASDKEKAALIMQVLQLSDDQIAQLPTEQRNSILVLKEQIAKSTGR